MGRKTPLYQQHLQSNAKIVDFGGWDMPLHYGSQINEHHQVRRSVGVFDVSHMTIIDLKGQRVREFLRYLLANDVGRLNKTGTALYSCLLNEQGGIIDDLIVYFQEETQFRIIVNASTREKDLLWIRQHAEAFKVEVCECVEHAILAIQGSKAAEKIKPLLPKSLPIPAHFCAVWHKHDIFVARTGYTGEDGFEIILPQQDVAVFWDSLLTAGVAPVGLGARDTLRLEAGMKLYGTDLDEHSSPFESGLGWTVSFKDKERHFIGCHALQDQTRKKMMLGLVLRDKGILRAHQTVCVDGKSIGTITSGTFSPTLGLSIGFARVAQGKYEHVQVMIRDKPLNAQVVSPPFVRQGNACFVS
ncbi:MAG: glycine cleavage system aminomethyltransferase GcvT [Thiomargarita sp.]|nr:glycine cleavage system aminomethyltransferase GcvT [Thiomargarita sp.]